MKTYRSNQTVEEGIYFNPRNMAFKSMDEEGGLPADPAGTWYACRRWRCWWSGP